MYEMTITATSGTFDLISAYALTIVAIAGLEMTGLLSWLVGAADAAVSAVMLRLRPPVPHAEMPAFSSGALARFLLSSLGLAVQANDNGRAGRDKAA